MSESTDFYMSWLGCNAFGIGGGTQLNIPQPVIVFKPTDLSDCSIWLDATDNLTITADGSGNVSSWFNKGDLSGSMVPDGVYAVPTTGIHTLNGNNMIWFDSNQTLTSIFQFSQQAYTMFLVGNVLSDLTVNNYASFFLGIGFYDFGQNIFWDSGAAEYWNGISANGIGGTIITTTSTDPINTPSIYAYRTSSDLSSNQILVNGVTQSLYINDFLTYTTSATNYWIHYPTHTSVFDVGEIIIYNRALSDSEVSQVQTYLADKFGI